MLFSTIVGSCETEMLLSVNLEMIIMVSFLFLFLSAVAE